MKKYTLTLSIMMVLFAGSLSAQVFGTDCPTLEQQQAAYNQGLANKVIVTNTASQQLQCYYQQLSTFWQQKDKTNQQLDKDQQQKNKDLQQISKDQQQIASDKALTLRLVELENLRSAGYDEVKLFIEAVLPLLGSCDAQLKEELKRIHTNRSGGGDLTNPGGGGNLRGFDNPHMVR